MPIYEYACQECGERHEAIQKLDDPPLTECPACGGRLKKLLSPPAFQFKGEGWYVTDYARKGRAGGSEKRETGGEGDGTPAAKEDGGGAKGKSPAGSGSGADEG